MKQTGFELVHGERIAGVDEVGRGPLAGPVVAAAVILDPSYPIDGLKDSKKLSPRRREQLAAQIRERALAAAVIMLSAAEIDRLNILQASLQAMAEAVAQLDPAADSARVDGNHLPKLAIPAEAVIGGDNRFIEIGAASILAKVERDRWMVEADRRYPDYGFAKHKGYPTPDHLSALKSLGPCELHRRSFAPVKRLLCEGAL